MAEKLSYTPKKRKKQVVEFDIAGEEFTFTAPKNAGMVVPVIKHKVEEAGVASLQAQFNWLSKGLGEKQAKRIEEMLSDEDNDLDWDGLQEITEWVIKQVNGRPTG